MQPLKPDEKLAITNDQPFAAPEDINRYEQLLSMRFAQDPDGPQAAPDARLARGVREGQSKPTIEEELQELHKRIFHPNDLSASHE